MDEAHAKAQATRQRNQETQRQLWEEQRAAISAARAALTRLLEREDATPAELLEATRLLVEIGRR